MIKLQEFGIVIIKFYMTDFARKKNGLLQIWMKLLCDGSGRLYIKITLFILINLHIGRKRMELRFDKNSDTLVG